ncbi:hypothetical protein SDC9_163545 [bioreactor metagenome]|uniref:Uncharacterized protein n=1 Tax=bioreactor metagenome TaxID=1076179 RepID=A0A645FP53_9ZZZZ
MERVNQKTDRAANALTAAERLHVRIDARKVHDFVCVAPADADFAIKCEIAAHVAVFNLLQRLTPVGFQRAIAPFLKRAGRLVIAAEAACPVRRVGKVEIRQVIRKRLREIGREGANVVCHRTKLLCSYD